MNVSPFFEFSFVDVIDILFVGVLLFYLYKLVKGTAAINIFIGIVVIYTVWRITDILNMDMVSNILGKFISVGVFALIVVFQQEIRKFLLLIGSTNFTGRKSIIRYFKFFNWGNVSQIQLKVGILIDSCKNMAKEKTGAIVVIERSNNLDFITTEENYANIELTPAILETLFFKDNPSHDGAVVIKNNTIKAIRVVLPLSTATNIPSRLGLRHRAAIGISERTDALVIVISEQTGKISYVKDRSLQKFKNTDELYQAILNDL